MLASAPSNTAVDNLLTRLAARNERVVRLGHPARVDATLQEHTLDALVENHENMTVVRDMEREAEGLMRKAGKYTRARPAPGARGQLRKEARQLRADARLLESQAVDHILDRADIICATTTYDPDQIGQRHFDLAVVDEACQSTEPGCWLPLLLSDRAVFAGDHCQLPPTVVSAQAAKEGFRRSLPERLLQRPGQQIARTLNVQYRMHEDIMRFSADQFYEGELQADETVRAHLLTDLEEVAADDLTSEPVTFVDTAGAGWEEELEPDGESKRNPQEGHFVLKKAGQLVAAGVHPRDMAIIAPYAAQIRWLRGHCTHDDLEIDTVDGFQGREKEVVLISLVRANTTGEIGFLADTRRTNVALTRARRKLVIVGDSSTLGGHDFYASLLEYLESIKAYHTVWEEE